MTTSTLLACVLICGILFSSAETTAFDVKELIRNSLYTAEEAIRDATSAYGWPCDFIICWAAGRPYSGGGPELFSLTTLVNHKGKHAIITAEEWDAVFPGDDPTWARMRGQLSS
jgi:hypothetical protein